MSVQINDYYALKKVELKECPFCGSGNLTIVRHKSGWVEEDYPYLYYVECCECLSRGTKKVMEQYAIDAWNQRAEQASDQTVKQGHWVEKHRHRGGYRQVTGKKPMSYETHTITIDERYEIDDLYCSECGKLNESVFTNFCPNCGADMRENSEPLQNAGADAAQFADQPVIMPAT